MNSIFERLVVKPHHKFDNMKEPYRFLFFVSAVSIVILVTQEKCPLPLLTLGAWRWLYLINNKKRSNKNAI